MFSPDPKLEKGTVLEQGSLPFIDVLLSHLMMIISKPTAAHLQTHRVCQAAAVDKSPEDRGLMMIGRARRTGMAQHRRRRARTHWSTALRMPFGEVSVRCMKIGFSVTPSRPRDCHSAAPPSTFSRCFNGDGERASAE